MKIVDHLPIVRGAPTSASPARVTAILNDVRDRGDSALRDWSEQLDRGVAPAWTVPQDVLERAWLDLPQADQAAIDHAARNIRTFADAQKRSLQPMEIEIEPGVFAGQRIVPVDRVACYVPGGRYPLPSTLLMTVIPALAAGVQHVVVLTPPKPNAWPDQHILAAAFRAGVTAVHPIGGAQGIAAAAFGTESIAAVDLIVGPGNAWVTEAKRQVYGIVGIDSLAGPSEVMVLCDATSDAATVAADLLAQAEHDPDAAAVLVSADRALLEAVAGDLQTRTAASPRRAILEQSLATYGRLVRADRELAIALAQAWAPEHLELCVSDPDNWLPGLTNAGAVFVGSASAEAFGDYGAGPNHVLPTNRSARYTSPLGVATFLKRQSLLRLSSADAAAMAPWVERLAEAEGLTHHGRSAALRAIHHP